MSKRTLFAAALVTLCLTACTSSQETSVSEVENPVISAIMDRRSIRQYKDIPVEREKLQLIAECGVNAPNGMNSQRWEIRIVDNKEMIDSISEEYRKASPGRIDDSFKNMFRNAPALVCVAVPEGDDGVNAGLLGQNVMLSAYSLGLGTVCLGGPVAFLKGSPAGQEFISRLAFSDGYSLLFIIGVGYPDETPDARPRDLGKIRFVE